MPERPRRTRVIKRDLHLIKRERIRRSIPMSRLAFLLALGATASALQVSTPHAKLVFLRHGQSTWNQLNLFTGWVDVPLSELGIVEATQGGQELKKAGLKFDVAYTSLLQRAQETCRIGLTESEQPDVPVIKDWRLNERHYGALQGKDKKETVAEFGEAQVKVWRRSYDVPPPPVAAGSQYDARVDPLYKGIDAATLPECACPALSHIPRAGRWEGVARSRRHGLSAARDRP